MARLNIDTGTAGNPATGDTLRTAMTKINTNFEELYLGLQQSDDQGGLITTNVTNGDIRIQPNGVGIIELDKLKVTDDDITSLVTNGNVAITGNGTGGVTIEGITFKGTELTSDDSTQVTIKENLNVTGVITGDGSGLTNIAAGSVTVDPITFVGDDSTGTAVNTGETFKIAGTQNVTTAVSGDTLTITGPDLSSYVTASSSATFTNKTFDADGTGNSITNIDLANLKSDVLDTDLSSVSGADDTIASAKAIKAYVDAQNTAQTITFVGDDSSGTAVNSGETFKVAGATGVTTAVSGDTLTITGTAQDFAFSSLTGKPTTLAGYGITDAFDGAFSSLTGKPTTISGYGITDAASSTATALTVVGDDSSGTAVTLGETFKVAGATGITTAVSGDTLTITGTSQDFAFSSITGKPTTLSGYGITDAASASGTALTVVGDDSSGTAVTLGETFKVAGATGVTTAVSGDTLTVTGPDLSSYLQNTGTQTIDNLTFNDNIIGTSSNADLELTPSGTGAVKVTQKLVLDTSDNDGSTVTIDATKPVAILQGNTGAGDNEYTLADGTVAGQTIMLVRGNNPDGNSRQSIHVIFSKFNDDGTIATNANKEIFSQFQSVVTCIWNGSAWCTDKHQN